MGKRPASAAQAVSDAALTVLGSPPVAKAAYYLRAVAPRRELSWIYRGMLDFTLLQVVGSLTVFLYLPIALWLPSCSGSDPGGFRSDRGYYLKCSQPARPERLPFLLPESPMTPSPIPPHGGEPPRPPRQPVFNAPPGVMWTTATLVVVHAVFNVLPTGWRYGVLELFAFVPAFFWAQFGEPGHLDVMANLSLVAHAFLHADLLHLFLNSGLLLAFGTLVERAMGTRMFLLLFALAAAGGAIAQAVAVGPAPVVMIGASGAVYGMIGAAIPYLFGGRLAQSRRSALTFIAVIMGLNLIFGAFGIGEILSGGGAIAWQAHIGGFVVGLCLGALRRGRRRQP